MLKVEHLWASPLFTSFPSNFNMKTKQWILQGFIFILVLSIIIGIAVLILAQIGKQFPIPPANSTEEWKEILKDKSPCKWYNLGCQKIACVIDCQEINRNAGEIICVC